MNSPTYKVDMKLSSTKKIWFHAKNIEAFYELLKLNTVYFWHVNDDITLTMDIFGLIQENN